MAIATLTIRRRRSTPYGPALMGSVVLVVAGVLVVFEALSDAAGFIPPPAADPGLATRTADVVGYFLAAVWGGCVVGARVVVIVGARPDDGGKIDATVKADHTGLSARLPGSESVGNRCEAMESGAG